jgi:hypothetical protein
MMLINIYSDNVVQTVNVGIRPSGLALDRENNVWVLSSGMGFDGFPSPTDTPGSLQRFNTWSKTIDRTLDFPNSDIHPLRLVSNNEGDRVYYLYNGNLHVYLLNEPDLDMTPFYDVAGNFYGLGYDPKTTAIMVSDPMDYVQRGKVHVIRENAIVVDVFDAGIIPGNFTFSE